jgi:cell division protein ZapA
MDAAARRMSNTLEVKLLGKDYRVACEPDEREGLLAAVALLDGKLKEAGDKTKRQRRARGGDGGAESGPRIARRENTPDHVAAALESETIQRRIDSIEAKLDESLAQHSQLF